jgi:hypothetical protein
MKVSRIFDFGPESVENRGKGGAGDFEPLPAGQFPVTGENTANFINRRGSTV